MEAKRVNPADVEFLDGTKLDMYRTLKEQGDLEYAPAELEVARIALVDALIDTDTTEVVLGTAMANHVNIFQAQRLPDIWDKKLANLETVRHAVALEVDAVAFLMLDKYGLDSVQVPSIKAIGDLVWRYAHDEHAESLREQDIRPYGVAATAAMLGSVALIEKV